jgi:membrane fusion protein (multidrug efflux system)
VNFGVPQQDAGRVTIGRSVRFAIEDVAGAEFTGRVTAINAVVDEGTRNVQIQATLANPRNILRPGMFVQAEVAVGAASNVVTLPATAVSYAPYGDSVFIVAEMQGPNGQPYKGVRQQFVKLGPSRGDQIAVLSGVKTGEEIVTSGAFKLRNGAAVYVDNAVQPANQPAPKPEDN